MYKNIFNTAYEVGTCLRGRAHDMTLLILYGKKKFVRSNWFEFVSKLKLFSQ